ncbi:TPA: hypothetical protein MIH01_25915 [Klebsiella pneumoniae]|nr:hypothetical protein [Klebsiella pneumoniae]
MVAQRTFEKTALQGGFFVYRERDYPQKKMISRRSFVSSVSLPSVVSCSNAANLLILPCTPP